MASPPEWRSRLEQALAEANQPTARYAQLATVRLDGRPANRTIVFRIFQEPDHQLVFTIDARSEKVTQLQTASWGELCWYFEASREQFRLLGQLMVVTETEQDLRSLRLQLWQDQSAKSQQSFTWPHPGEPRASIDQFQQEPPSDPPETFALLMLTPQRVDYLDLKQQPHCRKVYEVIDQGWTQQAINP